MVEGLDEDDRFRMVEDELSSMAGKYTAHLHAAEYHRQKQQAKIRNADTIDTISRPVVGRVTPGVRAKQDRLAKTRKRRAGVRKALANGRGSGLEVESEEESPWMGTSLQGLMEVPQGTTTRLSRLTSVGPSTKAAPRSSQGVREAEDPVPASRLPTRAGGGRRSGRAAADETTDDEDDLEVPAKRSTFPGLPPAGPAVPRATTRNADSRVHATAQPPQRHTTWPSKHREPTEGTGEPTSQSHEDQSAIVPLPSDSDDDLFSSLRRRRQESKAPRGARRVNPRSAPAPSFTTSATTTTAREHQKPEANNDIIPSFL